MAKSSAHTRKVLNRLRRPATCSRLAGDMERIADFALMTVQEATKKRPVGWSGASFGPPNNALFYRVECSRPMEPGAFGPGACANYVLHRGGPAAEFPSQGWKPRADVGNIFGLVQQMSRDVAKLWGCPAAPTSGFQGARAPRRKPRRRRR